MSESKKGENNPMFNKSLSTETKAKLSEAMSGEIGKTHTPETLAKMSGENNPNFGKTHSASGPRPDASPSPRGS